MAWDSNRPVPWKRLVREWAIYAGVMSVAFAVVLRDWELVGVVGGLVLSLPLYLALGYVLAKLGYQRTRLRRGSVPTSAPTATQPAAATRARPAPTRRTGSGGPARAGGRRRR